MQYFPQAGVFRFAEQRSHCPILVFVPAVEQDADDGRNDAVVPQRMVDLLLDQRIQQRAASFVAIVHVRPIQNALNDSEYVSTLDAPDHRFRGGHSVLEKQVQDVVVLARATGILGYGQSVLGVRASIWDTVSARHSYPSGFAPHRSMRYLTSKKLSLRMARASSRCTEQRPLIRNMLLIGVVGSFSALEIFGCSHFALHIGIEIFATKEYMLADFHGGKFASCDHGIERRFSDVIPLGHMSIVSSCCKSRLFATLIKCSLFYIIIDGCRPFVKFLIVKL